MPYGANWMVPSEKAFLTNSDHCQKWHQISWGSWLEKTNSVYKDLESILFCVFNPPFVIQGPFFLPNSQPQWDRLLLWDWRRWRGQHSWWHLCLWPRRPRGPLHRVRAIPFGQTNWQEKELFIHWRGEREQKRPVRKKNLCRNYPTKTNGSSLTSE